MIQVKSLKYLLVQCYQLKGWAYRSIAIIKIMKKSSIDILSAWRDYLKFSGAEKSKIPASQVHEDQQVMLCEDNCEESPEGLYLNIPSEVKESWRKRFVKYGDNGEILDIEPINLLFPVLRCVEEERGKSNVKYLPLFSFPLPKLFFSQKSSRLLIPVKDGQLVSASPFTFRDIFGIQLEELGENRHMMSIISSLTGQKYGTFSEAFKALLFWVRNRKNDKYHGLENAFNGLIAPLYNDDFSLKRDCEELSWLTDNPGKKFPLLEHYLNHIHDGKNPSEKKEVVTAGLFETHYPLGQGQMAAIQAINQNERLIAVQGAPGTGKTTLFKSLIAQQLVARAFAIADGNDKNFGMLVTSIARKAVENIIDDLRSDPSTQHLDWLWFHGGSNEQVNNELTRLERLLNRWNKENYQEHIQLDYLTQLNHGRNEIDKCFNAYQASKEAVLNAVSLCNLDTTVVRELPARFSESIQDLAKQLPVYEIFTQLSNPDELDELVAHLQNKLLEFENEKALRENALRAARTLQASWPYQHNIEEILRWIDSPLRPALENHYRDYPRKGFKRCLTFVFEKKYPALLRQMDFAAPEEFKYFNLSEIPHRQLAALADAGEILAQQTHNLELLKQLRLPAPDLSQEEALKHLMRHVKQMKSQWQDILNAQELQRQHHHNYPEGNWCNILRTRFVHQHRQMFEAAIGYLWQEQLKQKKDLEDVLNHWRALISNRRSSGYYRWLDKLDEFYRKLSLVYPVMSTTLVSARKLAGYSKHSELNGHKPWHLALCDEAGMISLEDLVPLLSRSEKAMIVGDPLQIEPIRNLSENLQNRLHERHFSGNNTLYERVSPATVTGWHRAAGTLSGSVKETGNGIILDEHRRCQKPIADLFIALAGYKGVSVETTQPSEHIACAFKNMGEHHLMFFSVEGKKGNAINTNIDEVDAIEQLLDKLEDAGYDLTSDIGIVTPYSNQKSLLIKRLAQRMDHWNRNCIGTVHQFQGVGFEVIIYSPVIFHPLDRHDFQNNAPNLLNVVVSRAKQQFIVVGNYHRLRQAGGYLKLLTDTVADDFILEHGTQHPDFEALRKTPRLRRYYRDCEHIPAFSALVSECEKELVIITPWIRQGQMQRPELAQLVATQQRGVKVRIYYGYYHKKYDRQGDNDETLIAEYQEKLGKENIIRLTEGTHEKVIMIDGRYIVLGSWNWLSHGYHDQCQKNGQVAHAIRHEISVELDDISQVQALRNRLQIA